MKIFFVLFLWILMAAVLAAGIVAAVKGSFLLLIVGSVGFILLVAKIGCLPSSH